MTAAAAVSPTIRTLVTALRSTASALTLSDRHDPGSAWTACADRCEC